MAACANEGVYVLKAVDAQLQIVRFRMLGQRSISCYVFFTVTSRDDQSERR